MMKRRPDELTHVVIPAELLAGPSVSVWASAELARLTSVPADHPQRAELVFQVQHRAWAAFRVARDAWLAENGHTLRELRTMGLLKFRAPYFD